MKFKINKILNRYPTINIGVVEGKDLKIIKKHPEVEKYKAEALLSAEDKVGCNPITRHPYISSWRNMYRSFGTKPGDYRPSAEALLRRALKKQVFPNINTSVDAYNAVSIKYIIPMGGFDIDSIHGDIELRFSPGNEAFTPLGSKKLEFTYEGEVVYADQQRILTRRWNYRDCEETKITAKTKNIVMFIDGSPEIPEQIIEKATLELGDLLKTSCKGNYTSNIAQSDNPVIDLGLNP
jgi:DNA/RNA-binding domain of Phe-tRNA-synthetase-like protein